MIFFILEIFPCLYKRIVIRPFKEYIDRFVRLCFVCDSKYFIYSKKICIYPKSYQYHISFNFKNISCYFIWKLLLIFLFKRIRNYQILLKPKRVCIWYCLNMQMELWYLKYYITLICILQEIFRWIIVPLLIVLKIMTNLSGHYNAMMLTNTWRTYTWMSLL